MKKIFSILVLAAIATIANAKLIDNADFSLTVPDNWMGEDLNLGEPISSCATILDMDTTSTSMKNMIMVTVYNIENDAKSLLEQQIVKRLNPVFNNCTTTGPIHETTIGGLNAQCVSYKLMTNAEWYEGTAYALNVAGGTAFVFNLSKDAKDENVAAILETLKFKNDKKVEKKTLAQRINEAAELIKKGKPNISGAVQITDMIHDEAKKTIEYDYTYLTIEKTDDISKTMKAELEKGFAEDLKNPIIRDAAAEKYTFRFRGLNKDNKQIYLVTLPYNEYKSLIK